jgi:hypothetical protein
MPDVGHFSDSSALGISPGIIKKSLSAGDLPPVVLPGGEGGEQHGREAGQDAPQHGGRVVYQRLPHRVGLRPHHHLRMRARGPPEG